MILLLAFLFINHPVAAIDYRFSSTPTGGLTVILDGSKSKDPDGTIVKYEWKWISGPREIFITDPAKATTEAAPDHWTPGVNKMQLTVWDNGGLSSSATVTITVNVQKCGFWDKVFRRNGCHF